MNPKDAHRRIVLNKNQSGRIEYCESCDVVEMEIGPVSIRLHAQDLAHLCDLIQVADQRLSYYHAEKAKNEMGAQQLQVIH